MTDYLDFTIKRYPSAPSIPCLDRIQEKATT